MCACEAAHVPVIWATQAVDTMTGTGQPSRAEVTDAAMSERAECVMLNNGPYITDAIGTLDSILTRTQDHQNKKRSMLRQLIAWNPCAHPTANGGLAGLHPSRSDKRSASMNSPINPHVAPVIEVLMKRSHGHFDEAFISDLVTCLTAEFDGAPVQDFVEVLVIKEAIDELRRLDEHRPIAS